MRTTLDIDDEVLDLARDRARAEHVSIGRALSEFVLERVAATTLRGEGEGLVRDAQGVLLVNLPALSTLTISDDDVAAALDDA